MIRQVSGLLRDAWWFMPMILIGSGFLGWLMKPLVGVVSVIASLVILVYFALMRYDEHGNERAQDI